jgi:hypothetical protein
MSLDRLIDGAREGADDPSAFDRARVRAKLSARVAAANAEAEGSVRRLSSRAGSRMTARLLVAAAVLVAGSASALLGRHVVLERARVAHESEAPATPSGESGTLASRPTAGPLAPASPASPLTPEAPTMTSPSPGRAAPRRAASGTTPALDAEMALLQEARDALRRGDPPSALSALGRYDDAFRSGVLRPEAAALRVFALCDAGEGGEARAHGAAFLKRWPRSPLADRVHLSCALEPRR